MLTVASGKSNVGVGEMVGVEVIVGVGVIVGVLVTVGVAVRVAVAVTVAVEVGVDVGVCVGVGVAMKGSGIPQALRKTAKSRQTTSMPADRPSKCLLILAGGSCALECMPVILRDRAARFNGTFDLQAQDDYPRIHPLADRISLAVRVQFRPEFSHLHALQ